MKFEVVFSNPKIWAKATVPIDAEDSDEAIERATNKLRTAIADSNSGKRVDWGLVSVAMRQ